MTRSATRSDSPAPASGTPAPEPAASSGKPATGPAASSGDPPGALPADLDDALLVGRVWAPAPIDGPCVVVVRDGDVLDVTAHWPTMADLLDEDDPAAAVRAATGTVLCSVTGLMRASSPATRAAAASGSAPVLLAPVDVQAIKASGVTFAVSLLERIIEEQAAGDPARAAAIRSDIAQTIGTDLSRIRPGSDEARRLERDLRERGLWSQYLEVGIGPDAEVFTKSQPMSAVAHGDTVGLHPVSEWNNPEPEIVLAISARGRVVGATLGNDVNLRDVEGRSALLLGKAKDNNASCAIGPFIRLFDEHFSIDTIRGETVRLHIEGADDGFVLDGESPMRHISRDPLDLVTQTIGAHHQYPDGLVLFLGTMFSPTQDRGATGSGFTHHDGDTVTISCPSLGSLVNRVGRSDALAPWRFGVRALYRSLARRGVVRVGG